MLVKISFAAEALAALLAAERALASVGS